MHQSHHSRYVAVLTILALLFGMTAGMKPAQAEVEAPTAMQAYVEAMHPGWNLGNTFDATGAETSWGNPAVTQELIDAIAADGYRSIRIPITWSHRMSGPPDYTIDPVFMDRIKEVIGWALDADLYVMINLHHDTHWIINMERQREEVLTKFKAAWVQLADTFKDYPDRLMFESINEPRFSEDWNEDKPIYFEMLEELNLAFHEIVRGSGGGNGTRPLVLSTVTGSPAQARLNELNKTIEKLNDTNLIATVHYYGYWPFSVNIAGSIAFDDAARNDLEGTFDRVYQTFVARGIPVIVGEYGLLGFDHSLESITRGEVMRYFEHLAYYAKAKGLTTMLWDNGQHFDREALTWRNPELGAVIQAGVTGRSSTATADAVYVKAGEAVQDAVIQLELNGNTLTEVKHGGRVLAAGTDYTLEGDTLTLKASLLEPLMTGEPGVKDSLQLGFSAGADWRLDLVLYETPEIRDADGTRWLFGIPIRYNGDSLATVESTYVGGGNAGPDDWTPFQQYGKAYEPDYELGLLMLKEEFFQAVRDGEILLKLHFRSGEQHEYRLTIEGDKVVGAGPGAQAEPEQPAEEPAASDDVPAADDSSSGAAASEAGSRSDVKPYAAAAITIIIAVILGFAYYRSRRTSKSEHH